MQFLAFVKSLFHEEVCTFWSFHGVIQGVSREDCSSFFFVIVFTAIKYVVNCMTAYVRIIFL